MSALISSIEHGLATAASDVVKVAKFWPQERPGQDAGDPEGSALPHALIAKLSVE